MSVNLQINNFWIERNERQLCRDLSFSVSDGELVRIAGDNGAGKSSLIKAILGWIPIEEGLIRLNGEDITHNRDLLLFDQIYLGHTPGIKSILSVNENLRMYCPNASEVALNEALQQVNLELFDDTPAAQLSAGQKRRVALARLWLTKKRIWFLDEPFTALDAHGVAALEAKIQSQLESGGAVVITTHQPLYHLSPKTVELTP
ncbi:cytochrome c biogenesis heme-transporting ATPase CcmA [Marinomonas piezotolerans]|uniref:Cytochrome c biogenesis heme-transporting ATPase CcmA n=1 Tax=Marinomonas piezotolerans TaxID=2213058 RepID=A0A370U777_9GAMM|nr:cytochrome c biogenesis heme-transporting ATPase CcmA [Marinomonas piezotolerans]RDL43629.1 cytochrome c biogenesis heme-transporting ATPase CcmA [Marinomonas piezotolerans]